MYRNVIVIRNIASVYRIQINTFSVKRNVKEKKKYSHTILLPKTQFPQWLNPSKRIELDDYIYKNCGFEGLYSWQRKHLQGTEFILHDGPPYANGLPHIGHAINKILKDIINRSKVLTGRKVDYRPGWDCHGLPIELKVLRGSTGQLSSLEVTQRARKYAKQVINDQRTIFKTWGLMADWEKCSYYTFDQEYVKNQLHQFYYMYNKNLIYRDMKPVHWSPSSRTALAEAELEYKEDHVSDAVTLRLRLVEGGLLSKYSPLYLLVWTTTPWTLPANEAVAFNSQFDYSIIKMNNENYIICSNLLKGFQEKINARVEEVSKIKGSILSDCKYEHPLSKLPKPVLPANYVTDNMGTGLVHTAPSHGQDDYVLGLENQLPVVMYIDESGNYTKEAGDNLQNLHAMGDGKRKVISSLKEDILIEEQVKHAYPYDWRTKKPTMMRASKQWFVNTNAIKGSAIGALQSVKIIPDRNKAGLLAQIESRPFWCISRQRAWGVPIPVLYDQNENVIISEKLIDHFCSLINQRGTDFWWSCSISDLIPQTFCEELGLQQNEIEKGKDILDIWFDSGISWSSVLNGKVADLYLEGIDQFTGWFQSSLLTSVALRGHAPYKTILAHGFAVDEEGRKMSKSIGNGLDTQEIIFGNKLKKSPPLGVDVLRWWVAAHSLQHTNIPASAASLDDSVNAIKKIRNIMKFLLGTINDLPCGINPAFSLIDKYILLKIEELQMKVTDMYETYEFNKICMMILNFLANDLSFYFTLTKDRLYCDESESERRRAIQITMNEMFHSLLFMIAPIVPVLAEEAYLYHPHNKDKSPYFYGNWKPIVKMSEKASITSTIEKALLVRERLLKERPVNVDISRISCTVHAGKEFIEELKDLQAVGTSYSSELVELLQASEVTLSYCDEPCDFSISIGISKTHFCERCRKYTSRMEDCLCQRCSTVLQSFR